MKYNTITFVQPMISCITSATVGASAASMRRTDIAASALAISEMVSQRFSISVDFVITITGTW